MRRGVLWLFSGNLLGKAVGLLREVVIAFMFGTSDAVIALRVATTGTLVPVNFFTSDSLSVGFVPNYSVLAATDQRRAVAYFRVVQRIVLLGGTVAGVLVLAFRYLWVGLIAPGSSPGVLSLAANMLTIMGLASPFYVYVALASYLEMSDGNYRLASARPAIQSTGLIAGAVLGYFLADPLWLAWGFTLAYLGMSLWALLRFLGKRRKDQRWSAPLQLGDAGWAARLFFRTLAPVVWLPLLSQGAWVAERAIASTVSGATVAAIDYARNITDTAYVLISAPLGLVVLSAFANLDQMNLRARTSRLTQQILLVSVPVSTALWMTSDLIVSVLYQRGAFDETSMRTTSAILAGLSVGVWAQTLAYAFLKVLNAQRRNMAAGASLATGSIAWILVDYTAAPALGPAALGIGWAVGSMIQLIVSSTMLQVGRQVWRGLLLTSPLSVIGVAIWGAGRALAMPQWVTLCAFGLSASAYVAICPPLRAEVKALLRR